LPSPHIEREVKLALLPGDLARNRARLAPLTRRARKVTSIYYDTADERLRRAGMALRLRRDGRTWLQTLKVEKAPGGGLAQRAEWEMPVQGKALELEAFPRAGLPVDICTLGRRLRPRFETRFVRRSGVVALHGGGEAELAIDSGAIVARGRRAPIREVELELRCGTHEALLRFARGLGLALAYESKAERGYRLAAGQPDAPRKWRMPAISASDSPGTAFASVFAAALTQAGSNAAGMLGNEDPEYLHQMRVGLRRARSALRAFSPILRRTRPLKMQLTMLMPALGRARDWDVLAQSVRSAALRRRRAQARHEARAIVRAGLQVFLVDALLWLHAEPWRESPLGLPAFGRNALDRLHGAAQRSRLDTEKRRHRLRIRLKRLRYACEFFAPCFPQAATQRYLRELERLQDILGALQDLVVARRLLGESPISARERRLMRTLDAAWPAFARRAPYWRRAIGTPRLSPR
jgi:inorganic triphosphatase YgiF